MFFFTYVTSQWQTDWISKVNFCSTGQKYIYTGSTDSIVYIYDLVRLHSHLMLSYFCSPSLFSCSTHAWAGMTVLSWSCPVGEWSSSCKTRFPWRACKRLQLAPLLPNVCQFFMGWSSCQLGVPWQWCAYKAKQKKTAGSILNSISGEMMTISCMLHKILPWKIWLYLSITSMYLQLSAESWVTKLAFVIDADGCIYIYIHIVSLRRNSFDMNNRKYNGHKLFSFSFHFGQGMALRR
mgnify:CR=1 FL=1